MGRGARERDVRNLTSQLLLDTHVLIRWLVEPERLSKEQDRVLRRDDRRGAPLDISATTLVEIALLSGGSESRSVPVNEVFAELEFSDRFHIVPIDPDIAREIAALGDSLRDPADRAIVATARSRPAACHFRSADYRLEACSGCGIAGASVTAFVPK